jgi:ubiquinone/menaquinone biosynthesis C-methylase UbiE
MAAEQSFARVKDTFEQWALYESVVRHNYMLHAELIESLGRWAAANGRPLVILDLGCGDAWLPTRAFPPAAVERYQGVDLSDSAIERAREHLKVWPGLAKVSNGNLFDFLGGLPDESVNLVFASYSLHHFHTPQKIEILAQCHRVLEPDGTLIWIDSVMRDGESRDEYLTRQTVAFRTKWTGLTEEQREKVVAHVWESDFPESGAWMHQSTAAAGFGPGEPLLEGEFFAAWAYRRT